MRIIILVIDYIQWFRKNGDKNYNENSFDIDDMIIKMSLCLIIIFKKID